MEDNNVVAAAVSKIFFAEPADVPAGMQLVSFSRKSTKEKPVADGDKYRGCFVPKLDMGTDVSNSLANEHLPSQFREAITEAVEFAASEILKSYCTEKASATEVSADLLTFAAVLAKMQEQQTAQRMKGESILAWYDASKTKDYCIEHYTKSSADEKIANAKLAIVRKKYASLASNNPSIKGSEMEKLLAFIQEGDLAHPVAKALAKKLAKLMSEQVQADEI